MKFQVNKDLDYPIYQQLKEQIKFFLLSGELKPDSRVPTPKDLAAFLNINKNTVVAAYKELEKEGMLMTKQGKGTFVATVSPDLTAHDKKQDLFALVRQTIERTKEFGFSEEDLFTVVFNYIVMGKRMINEKAPKVLFIECNEPDLKYYQQELQKELEIMVEACLVSELNNKNEEFFKEFLYIITTFSHIEDVKAVLEPYNKNVLAIMAMPHFQTLMRIGQLPPGTCLGLYCWNERSALNMRKSLEATGIKNITIEHAGMNNLDFLKETLNNIDVAVGSRVIIDELKKIVPKGLQVLEYTVVLDKAGLQMLKEYINRGHL